MEQVRHLSINIESILKIYEGKEINIFSDDDGNQLSDKEAREEIDALRKLGHKLLPSSNCEGFDPFGGGCPGHSKNKEI